MHRKEIKIIHFATVILLIVDVMLNVSIVSADYKDDIGFTRLENEMGTALSDGAGIQATIAEASASLDHDNDSETDPVTVWMPDPSHSLLSEDTLIDKSGSPAYYSNHASTVAYLMLGSNAMAHGMDTAKCFIVDNWRQSGCLRMHKDRVYHGLVIAALPTTAMSARLTAITSHATQASSGAWTVWWMPTNFCKP